MTDEQRGRALALLDEGHEKGEAARRLQVSNSVMQRLFQRFRESGTVQERHHIGRPRAGMVKVNLKQALLIPIRGKLFLEKCLHKVCLSSANRFLRLPCLLRQLDPDKDAINSNENCLPLAVHCKTGNKKFHVQSKLKCRLDSYPRTYENRL